jgi:hypothetical protein
MSDDRIRILSPGRYSLDHGETWHTEDDFAKMLHHAEERRRRTPMPEITEPTEPPLWQRNLFVCLVSLWVACGIVAAILRSCQ